MFYGYSIWSFIYFLRNPEKQVRLDAWLLSMYIIGCELGQGTCMTSSMKGIIIIGWTVSKLDFENETISVHIGFKPTIEFQ